MEIPHSPGHSDSNTHDGLRISMFTPARAKCGISDYSRFLIAGLKTLPSVTELSTVEAPDNAVMSGKRAILRYFQEADRYRKLGSRMNTVKSGTPADIAHIQHQYFLFGGVAPHKNHIRDFLGSIHISAVLTVHEIAHPSYEGTKTEAAIIQSVNRQNFLHPAISEYIVHTNKDRESLINIGVPPDKIHHLIHGIPTASPMPSSEAAKRRLELEGKRVITLFGFLSAKKGHKIAIDALLQLPDDVILLFAGDRHPEDRTDYVSKLTEHIAKYRLSDRVRITGYLPEEQIPVIMAATDVALAPFLESSGSGSLANLLAYGRAILASDIEPHLEINSEAPACLKLFRSGEVGSLVKELTSMLEESGAEYQTAALEYAARHSYLEMAKKTVEIYLNAIARG